jgi:hypothetical protein
LYQNKHPEQIKKLVLLDVGLLKPHTIPIVHALIITGYQIWFALSFIVCQLLGSTIGTIFMGLYFLPFLKPIWPTTDKGNISLKEIRADKCYPYFYLWKSILTLNMISPSFPNCSTLYLVSSSFQTTHLEYLLIAAIYDYSMACKRIACSTTKSF